MKKHYLSIAIMSLMLSPFSEASQFSEEEREDFLSHCEFSLGKERMTCIALAPGFKGLDYLADREQHREEIVQELYEYRESSPKPKNNRSDQRSVEKNRRSSDDTRRHRDQALGKKLKKNKDGSDTKQTQRFNHESQTHLSHLPNDTYFSKIRAKSDVDAQTELRYELAETLEDREISNNSERSSNPDFLAKILRKFDTYEGNLVFATDTEEREKQFRRSEARMAQEVLSMYLRHLQ